jgi:hypothetical protein
LYRAQLIFNKVFHELSFLQLHIHKTVEDLHQFVPKSVLPTELGGEAGPMSVFAEAFAEKMFAARVELLNNRKYGVDETKRVGKPKNPGSDESVVGTFRKLTVD